MRITKNKRQKKEAIVAFKISSTFLKQIQDAADKYAEGNVSLMLRRAVTEYMARNSYNG